MYPEVATAMQDRKRKRDEFAPASDQLQVSSLHFMESLPTSCMPEDARPKRQHVLVSLALLVSVMNIIVPRTDTAH